ncbi:MinD/ParA family protein [Paenibacillus sediminis]|uniref:Flagellar biosynthesis protein FlhG n=1 Tax=Paenibacillus sediminis TaxID=664909 RepID=A0ABS4H1J5_9BACL|nr:MinD/ParA family protein [Paenibacillus sediminis]MBP1936406.1 flagellar biosynthesis protein FlhG [Paenibacillus sediminis]
MMDQAEALRKMVSSLDLSTAYTPGRREARILAVSSGKGGVGKSNFTLNFALALKKMGRKVLVFDADIGMGNIDVLMGVRSRYNFLHLIRGEQKIRDIVESGPEELSYIAGGSGLTELFNLSESDIDYFTRQLEEVSSEMDFIIFDTGAGLSKENLQFITAADECFIVTTPEPTAITDAYALMKVVYELEKKVNFKLVINRAADEREGIQTADKLSLVARKFLNLDVPLLGVISDDVHVMQAVKKQVPFSLAFPNSPAARDIQRLALRYMAVPSTTDTGTVMGIKGFMQKWLRRTK